MRFYPLLFVSILILIVFSCLSEPKNNLVEVHLADTLFDPLVGRHFYTPENGWDTINPQLTLINLPEFGRTSVEIHSRDVVLGRGDSVRISIIHPVERMFRYPETIEGPDYIALTAYGLDTLPIAVDQANIGPISRRTYFRVGRQQYRLAAIDSTRTQLAIEPLQRGQDLPITAAFEPNFQRVPVRSLSGDDTIIDRQADKELILYFWRLGADEAADLRRIDSLYRQLPPEVTPEIVGVNRADSRNNLANFLTKYELKIPIYQNTAQTCRSLACHPMVPYGVLVNKNGRIVTHYFYRRSVMNYLEHLLDTSKSVR